MLVIDSHIHCGVQNVSQPFSVIRPMLEDAGISGACLFAPVEDIYDRTDRNFDDNDQWRACRQRANTYILNLAEKEKGVYPYYFVWNDFMVEDLDRGYKGVKWHRHEGEPEYRYDDPACEKMIDAICARVLPVVLEESYDNTMAFIDRVGGRTPVIIPHLGLLNGGFDRLFANGVWQDESVYADTALAGLAEIHAFVDRYGARRLLFGSDWPFGHPDGQLRRLMKAEFSDDELKSICAGNIQRLIRI